MATQLEADALLAPRPGWRGEADRAPQGEPAANRPRNERRVALRTARFDWAMAIVSCWFVGGLFLDAWAHIHLSNLETFFTPWHGVMYSGFLAVVTFITATMV